MKKRILALLLSLSLMVSVVVPGTVAMDGGDTVNDTYTELAVNGRETLHASQFGISAEPYQWQISIGGTWINISGETSDSITVSYAMLCNALSGDTAQVRCVGYDSEGTLIESDAMTIRITEEVAPTPVEQEETHPAGTVLEQAKPLGDPIIEKIKGESENIKDQIKEKFDEFKDNAKDALDQIKDSAKEKLEELKNKIDEKNDPEPIDQTEETSAETTAPAETSAEPASTDDSAAADDSVVTGGSETTNVETDTAPTTDEDAGDDDVSDQTEMTETTGEAEPENPADSEDKTPAAEEPADTTTEQEVTTSAPETEAPVTEAPETDAPVATEPSEGSDEDVTEDIVISAPSFASPLTDEEPSDENKENDTQTPPPAPAEQTPPTSPSDPVTTAAPEKQEEPTGNTENTDENQKTPENTEQKDVPSDEQNNVPTVTDSANNGQENDTPAGETPEPTTYTIRINYQFADGTPVTDPWSSDAVETGYSYKCDIKSPVVAGFTPDMETVSVDASEGVTYTVTYQPVELEFTVTHYQQNVSNDEYTEFETETRKCVYSDVITDIGKTYEGFFTIPCGEQTISKDGTVINVYYDRYYYLITYPLADGTGEGKVYARFGEEIAVESSFDELYEKLMAAETMDELLALTEEMTEDEANAFLASLTDEQVAALQAHIEEIAPAEEHEPPETVVFTDAGPFMPAVSVENGKRMLRAARTTGTENGDGLVLSKEVTNANDDGSYTIRMEAYTTGKVTTTTKTTPVDIVLVLDQSGSMAYDFNGNESRRQYAMKQAVNNFISEVNSKYSGEADHRMAIVTFGSDASTLQGWTNVDPSGMGTLKGKINELPNIPSGATNVAAGMNEAEKLIGVGYSYNGSNRTRQKVVIVFTDGVPTTSTDFDTDVANNAISSAKKLKDDSVTIYTIGIFNSANPEQLYGESGFDRNSNGTIGSDWSNFSFWKIGDIKSYDIPAGNRFLNFLSSNFNDATKIGITEFKKTFWGIGYRGWKITDNFDRKSNSYYLTASNEESLNKIFTKISENIQTSDIDLGSETIIKDTVSKYFDLPTNTSDIRLYTADAKADGSFDTPKLASSDVKPEIKDGVVTVTGFDFNANFVTDKVKKDGTFGKKLIIEFEIKPKNEFIGGNDVPTNDWENSGVYKDGTIIKKFADKETTPTVNVPIKTPEFTVNNKTIYKGNSTQVSGLYEIPDTSAWQFDFVTASVNGIDGKTVSPEDCTDYNVTLTYAPMNGGSKSKGTPNDMSGVPKEMTVTVHVLKPIVNVTVNDIEKKYGESYTLGDDIQPTIAVEWKDSNHGDVTTSIEGSAPYTKENLRLVYSTDEFTGQTGTVPNHSFDVSIRVMNGDNEITSENATLTITTTCNIPNSGCTTPETDGKYTVHVMTCSLKIVKKGFETIDENQTFIFNIKGEGIDLDVVVEGGKGSVTIKDLRIGSYTITEKTDWSWRYKPEKASQVITLQTADNTVTFNNERENVYWLNGCAYAPNKFGSPITTN